MVFEGRQAVLGCRWSLIQVSLYLKFGVATNQIEFMGFSITLLIFTYFSRNIPWVIVGEMFPQKGKGIHVPN